MAGFEATIVASSVPAMKMAGRSGPQRSKKREVGFHPRGRGSGRCPAGRQTCHDGSNPASPDCRHRGRKGHHCYGRPTAGCPGRPSFLHIPIHRLNKFCVFDTGARHGHTHPLRGGRRSGGEHKGSARGTHIEGTKSRRLSFHCERMAVHGQCLILGPHLVRRMVAGRHPFQTQAEA
jgi:hypothetical protein